MEQANVFQILEYSFRDRVITATINSVKIVLFFLFLNSFKHCTVYVISNLNVTLHHRKAKLSLTVTLLTYHILTRQS